MFVISKGRDISCAEVCTALNARKRIFCGTLNLVLDSGTHLQSVTIRSSLSLRGGRIYIYIHIYILIYIYISFNPEPWDAWLKKIGHAGTLLLRFHAADTIVPVPSMFRAAEQAYEGRHDCHAERSRQHEASVHQAIW